MRRRPSRSSAAAASPPSQSEGRPNDPFIRAIDPIAHGVGFTHDVISHRQLRTGRAVSSTAFGKVRVRLPISFDRFR